MDMDPMMIGRTDCLSAPGEICRQAPSVVDRAGTDHVDGLSGERRGATFDGIDARGDKDGSGCVASVASTFTGLGTDEVDADVQGLLDVLGVSDHVHDNDASLVQTFDDVHGRNTDCADEQARLLLDNDVDEFIKLTFLVVVLRVSCQSLL